MQYAGRTLRIVGYVGHGVNDIFWYILPLVLPLILADFGLSYAFAGGIVSIYLVIISILSFVFGKLSDRSSRWVILAPGFFAASAGLFLSSFMPSLALLIFFLGIAAIGVSVFHPLMYAFIDERNVTNRGNVFGVYEMWGVAAVFVMYIVNGLLLNILTWRSILLITSVPGFMAGLLYIVGRPDSHKAHNAVDNPGTGGGASSSAPASSPAAGRAVPPVLFILFLLAVFIRLLGITGIVNFLPMFMVREIGAGSALSAFATGFYFLGGLVSTVLAGKAGDRWGVFPSIIGATLLTVPAILLLLLPLPLWVHGFLLFLFGAGSIACFPLQGMIISRLVQKRGAGEVFGILVALITLVSAAGPILLGLAADSINLRGAFLLFTAPVAVSVIILLVLTFLPASKEVPGAIGRTREVREPA